jgi:hypothetical protein
MHIKEKYFTTYALAVPMDIAHIANNARSSIAHFHNPLL